MGSEETALQRIRRQVIEMNDESERRIASAVKRETVVREEEGYGLFPGGDPRRFRPDEESCTPEEIAAHRAACEAWDRGEGVDRGPSCATLGDGSAWSGKGYGVGPYTVDVEFLICTYADGSTEEFF
jgi:hypothetical protein